VQLPAIRELQLEGTSITDVGCKTLAAKASVSGVNVAHCTNVTLRGLMELAHSDNLRAQCRRVIYYRDQNTVLLCDVAAKH
jgi:hypothetical protein